MWLLLSDLTCCLLCIVTDAPLLEQESSASGEHRHRELEHGRREATSPQSQPDSGVITGTGDSKTDSSIGNNTA